MLSAAQPLVDAEVTGYTSTTAAGIIYAGSFAWFLLLLVMDGVRLSVGVSATVDVALALTIGLNTLMFALQSWNVWVTVFRAWPLVALYYTAQISVLGISAALLGHALGQSIDDVYMAALRLVAQALFTSSQLSVTLEFLHRSVRPAVVVAPQGRGRR